MWCKEKDIYMASSKVLPAEDEKSQIKIHWKDFRQQTPEMSFKKTVSGLEAFSRVN